MYNSHDAFRSEPAVRAQSALRAARVKGERPEEKEDVVPAKLVPLRWGKPSTLLGIRNLYVSITHTHTHTPCLGNEHPRSLFALRDGGVVGGAPLGLILTHFDLTHFE